MTEAEAREVARLLSKRDQDRNALVFVEEDLKNLAANAAERVARLGKIEDELAALGVVL